MTLAPKRAVNRLRMKANRDKLRAQQLSAIQPDTSTPEFAREAKRQSLLIANSPHEADDQAFIDSISELKFD